MITSAIYLGSNDNETEVYVKNISLESIEEKNRYQVEVKSIEYRDGLVIDFGSKNNKSNNMFIPAHRVLSYTFSY